MYAQALVPSDDVTFVTEMDGFETMETEVKLRARETASEDITDPNALSIQEEKLRSEENYRMKKAEERKAEIRNKVALLRDEFRRFIDINQNEDSWIQLSEKDFNIDPEYFEMLAKENLNKKEITKKEVAWGIEYRRVALEKLRTVFFHNLEYDRFTVKAIKTDSFVTTFRVKKMSEFLEENVRRFKEMIDKEYHPQSGSDDDIQSIGSSQRDDDVKQDRSPHKLNATQFQGQGQQNKKKKTEAELKREERTKAREERKREIERHAKEEDKFSQEDPKDIEKIEVARNTYGDYKLKMSPEYIVPEKERVNAEKKRQQMILLENSIFNLKSDFNKTLEELKHKRKMDIINLAAESNKRIAEINAELGIEEELFMPKIDEKVEYPENFYNISMEDIIGYVHKKGKDSEVQVKASMFGGKKEDKQLTLEQKYAIEFEKIYREEQRKKQQEEENKKAAVKEMAVERKTRQPDYESEVDIEVRKIKEIELRYEKEQIQNKLNTQITEFDENISELQKEKYRLESDLKQAEMKLITFYEELIILNGMEARDKELTKSLAE